VIRYNNGEKKFINEDFTFDTDIFRISDIKYVSGLFCFSLYGYWHCYVDRKNMA